MSDNFDITAKIKELEKKNAKFLPTQKEINNAIHSDYLGIPIIERKPPFRYKILADRFIKEYRNPLAVQKRSLVIYGGKRLKIDQIHFMQLAEQVRKQSESLEVYKNFPALLPYVEKELKYTTEQIGTLVAKELVSGNLENFIKCLKIEIKILEPGTIRERVLHAYIKLSAKHYTETQSQLSKEARIIFLDDIRDYIFQNGYKSDIRGFNSAVSEMGLRGLPNDVTEMRSILEKT